jgi:hypothetical protein
MSDNNELIDINQDGIIDAEEKRIAMERWEIKKQVVIYSLLFIFLITIFVSSNLYFDINIDRLRVITDFLEWVLAGCFSLIAGYMGVSTWREIKK